MKVNWQVYYQNNGKGDKWIHKTFDTRLAAETCYQKKVAEYSEDDVFSDSTDVSLAHKPKNGDLEGFHIRGFLVYATVPREWRMYWGLREIQVPEDED